MELFEFIVFLLLVAVGAYVQTITGFAMGLLIVGGVTILNLAPIALTAAVVSILSLVNTSLILRHSIKHVSRWHLKFLLLGMIPGVIGGVELLNYFSGSQTELLQKALGLVIIIAGILLTLKPTPWEKLSGRLPLLVTGIAGGLFGGMFSTGGAPPAFLMYRQPLNIIAIRATLLAIFFITTFTRTVSVILNGQLDSPTLKTCAFAVPMVLLITHYAPRFAPKGGDIVLRKCVFILLILIGLMLLIG